MSEVASQQQADKENDSIAVSQSKEPQEENPENVKEETPEENNADAENGKSSNAK